MDNAAYIPDPPRFSEEEVRTCRESKDFRPIFFEWYKFTATLCNVYANLMPESPVFRPVPPIQFAVCTGLLNRCSKLMLSNMALSHTGSYGEATAIIDRSIFESAVKLSWLCSSVDPDAFRRYIADGLKTELEFKAAIEAAISNRGGEMLVIEKRMMASIDRQVEQSTLTENEIMETKKLPDLAAMMKTIGLDRLMYIAGQKIGSHHVHGTWCSLTLHYLDQTPDGRWHPDGRHCPTHQNQYFHVSLMVIAAMKWFARFSVPDAKDRFPLESILDSVREELTKIMGLADEDDFEGTPAT
jgi:Family of unknown function (DUF5677)